MTVSGMRMSHAHNANHRTLIGTRNQIDETAPPGSIWTTPLPRSGYLGSSAVAKPSRKTGSASSNDSVRNAYLFPPSVFGPLSRPRRSPLNPDGLRSPTSAYGQLEHGATRLVMFRALGENGNVGSGRRLTVASLVGAPYNHNFARRPKGQIELSYRASGACF